MKKIYTIMFVISLALFVASVGALGMYGLNFGVDFKGGSIIELEFKNGAPNIEEVKEHLSKLDDLRDKEVSVNSVGERGVIVRTGDLTEKSHQTIVSSIGGKFPNAGVEEKRFESVGPAIGKELRNKSITAILIVLIAIMTYIAFAFRKLSRTLPLWAMNVAAIVGLLHDIVIPLGVFAILGHFLNVQIGAVFVAAILTILGYTISDKVVIFDRVRENILRGAKADLGTLVHKSVMQTLVRSINNTLTVMLSSFAMFLFGGESIKYFALALMIGIFLGAYSSIFVASPLLVWLTAKRGRS